MEQKEQTFDISKDYELDCQLVKFLPQTHYAFFQSFGRFTPVQRHAIIEIINGNSALIVSGTASGKTEAACAPLIERNLKKKTPWTILYISPTKALVNDLYYRLLGPTQRLNLRLKRRTGDHRDNLKQLPHVLITTPESFDSLLCRNKREDALGHDLANVVAVVLDEIHLLHGTPRGEQIKWLLARLKKLRIFAKEKRWSRDSNLQIIGLSATVSNPESVLHEYFPDDVKYIECSKRRTIETINPPSSNTGVKSALTTYLKNRYENEKLIVFSNSRKRVDELAAYFKTELHDVGYEVYAHHGSLSKGERESAEERVKNKGKIVLCATSTLEIGVDIGDIDLIVLDGPAPDISSLLQRIGRGNRRTNITRVLVCAESVADFIIQNAMIDAARDGWLGNGVTGPNYTVVKQQIASYLFQAPSNSRSEESLKSLFNASLIDKDIFNSILNEMIQDEELYISNNIVKLGEYWWKQARRMGNIHSTIEKSSGMKVVDIDSGQTIASDVVFRGGNGVNIGGKSLKVCKWKEKAIEVRDILKDQDFSGNWSYNAFSHHIHSSQPAALKRYLGVAENVWPIVRIEGHQYVFHFGGAVRYSIISLLNQQYAENPKKIKINEWYIRLPDNVDNKPLWLINFNKSMLKILLNTDLNILGKIEKILNRPLSNKQLPHNVRVEEVWEWLNIDYESEVIMNSDWRVISYIEINDVLKHFI
ncbi:Helicase conserved C-terminal domain-containing protein [Methanococcoides vulcani]|uniref:Helicase conserved C-terminal domain-containing protein n=1 Tax=Methanococcoides vulcani TaxID=1353158 RepID=A0A1I0B760_9EURY|nr:DEAD/DEAH box helicase [Methanococcoides vulcani]SET02542.1 Helicase conserved C-terminal domain-containing protein [Methanococcoides vulcani]